MAVYMTLEEYNNLPRKPKLIGKGFRDCGPRECFCHDLAEQPHSGEDCGYWDENGRRLLYRVVPWGLVVPGEQAYQKKVRDRYLSEGMPEEVSFKIKDSVVKPISKQLAKKIILKYEWLGTMQKTDLHYGIFFGDHCAGVSCIGKATAIGATNLFDQFYLDKHQVRVLARGACVHWAPLHTNSRLTGKAAKLVHEDAPETKIILAYADEEAGEIGTIYQACNWYYLGKTLDNKSQYVAPPDEHGEVRVYDRQVINHTLRQDWERWCDTKWRLLLEENWYIQDNSQKHVYAYVLDKRDKKLMDTVCKLALPYPKRCQVP